MVKSPVDVPWMDDNPTIRSEVVRLAQGFIPITLSFMSEQFCTVLGFTYLSALPTEEFAGASLGNMFCNFSGFAVTWGIVTALDTLLCQAHGADIHSPLLSIYSQRALAICVLMSIPIAMMWTRVESILLFVRQEPTVSHAAAVFALADILNLATYVPWLVIYKFLECTQHTREILLPTACGTLVVPFLLYIFVTRMNLGIVGVPMALSITNLVSIVTALITLRRAGITAKYWHGWSRTAFQDWSTFFALGVPSCVMTLIEWGTYEMNGIVAGWISPAALGAQAITMQLCSIMYSFPYGFGTMCTVRMGAYLGAGNVTGAKTVLTAAFLTVLLGTSVNVFVYMTRYQIPTLFSTDPEVVSKTAHLLVYMCIFNVVSDVCSICSGAVRALGYPHYGVYFNAVAYGIGLPLGWTLTFLYAYQESGLWIGIIFGLCLSLTGYLLFFAVIDWSKAADLAASRIENGLNDLHLERERILSERVVEQPLYGAV